METYFPHIFLAGLATALIGFFSLVVVAFVLNWKWGMGVLVFPPTCLFFAARYPRPARNPIILLFLGLAAAAFPPIYTKLTPIDLGPRDKLVGTERHVTLTGWDRNEYSILQRIPDAIVLQMANADVTDEVIQPIAVIEPLRELDLNDTKVTDSGLASLRSLTHLERLRLRNTTVSDKGFSEYLAPMESLKELDVRGTQVSRDAIKAWKEAKPGRKALQ